MHPIAEKPAHSKLTPVSAPKMPTERRMTMKVTDWFNRRQTLLGDNLMTDPSSNKS